LCTDGWTDSHHEPNTRSSEVCEVPDISHCRTCKIFTKKLTFVGIVGAVYGNVVTVVFHCYNVEFPTIRCCKSDINECYCVEALVGTSILELHNVRQARLYIIYRQLTKSSSTVL
jgi:hypothetical protein